MAEQGNNRILQPKVTNIIIHDSQHGQRRYVYRLVHNDTVNATPSPKLNGTHNTRLLTLDSSSVNYEILYAVIRHVFFFLFFFYGYNQQFELQKKIHFLAT